MRRKRTFRDRGRLPYRLCLAAVSSRNRPGSEPHEEVDAKREQAASADNDEPAKTLGKGSLSAEEGASTVVRRSIVGLESARKEGLTSIRKMSNRAILAALHVRRSFLPHFQALRQTSCNHPRV